MKPHLLLSEDQMLHDFRIGGWRRKFIGNDAGCPE